MPMWDAWRKLTNYFIYNRLRETQPLEPSVINRDPVARFHQGGGFRPAGDCGSSNLGLTVLSRRQPHRLRKNQRINESTRRHRPRIGRTSTEDRLQQRSLSVTITLQRSLSALRQPVLPRLNRLLRNL